MISADTVLSTLLEAGEQAAIEQLLDALDREPMPTRRNGFILLSLVPGPQALAWLEARLESPVTDDWGRAAVWSGIGWPQLEDWLAKGRPHSLAALDALIAYAVPGAGRSVFDRALVPILDAPPSMDVLRGALARLQAVDDAPRVTKSISLILSVADEILRGGTSPGIPARDYFAQQMARKRAERAAALRNWSESRRELPVPPFIPVPGTELRNVWIQRWEAAAAACRRKGGEAHVHVGDPLSLRELRGVEDRMGMPVPASIAEVLTRIASTVDVRWFLPTDLSPPAGVPEIGAGMCNWDAQHLAHFPVGQAIWSKDPTDEYERVWQGKIGLLDVPNGDAIGVDVERADAAPVVYLSHDGDEMHGRVLGYSLVDFLDRWSLLGCVGPDAWELEPFVRADQPYLDVNGDAARAWRAWFELG